MRIHSKARRVAGLIILALVISAVLSACNSPTSWIQPGRSPKVNGAAGRDHWNFCYGLLLAGGGVKGGYVHGASDRIGARPSQGPVTPGDVVATIYHCLGIDPGLELQDRLARPFALLPQGAPIREVIG